MMIKYSILNKNIYINPVNFTYSFNEEDLQGIAPALSTSLPEDKILRIFKPKCYSFGIDISDKCNLRCSYCFNKNMTGRIIPFEKAKDFLDKMFSTFPNGEKYFVDLSGSLAFPFIPVQTHQYITDSKFLSCQSIDREFLFR